MSSAAAPTAQAPARLRGRPDAQGRPRLLHVFPNFDVGGVQVRFAALVAGFGDRYHHTVVSLGGGYAAADLIQPGQPVWYAKSFASDGGLLARLAHHRARLAELRPDLLVTYNWGAMEVALANRLARTPHLHLEDGFGPEEAHAQLPRRVWTRRLALAGSQVVVPSQTLQALATRTWRLRPPQVHLIPNGLAHRPSRRRAARAHGRQTRSGRGLDPSPARPCIVWVGALRPEKNPLRLLRAFAPLKGRAQLLLVGDGPERDAVAHEAERLALGESLRLAGHRLDARDLVAGADILALSSDTEQMPFAVLEAMDAGLPVASTDVGDVRRMVCPENRRFVVPPCDSELSRALQVLVDDPELRVRIGEANRLRVAEVYSLEGMIEAHRALLDDMLARRRPELVHA